ncbi:hypothetical protein [Virgibacillus sediminis]|uniref:Uncharacterized protein n=1 Tax=Virgibacillus sediminis TaxID=202260 RepID=A0ABV7A1N6_9BACI
MKKLLILAFLVPFILAACGNDETTDEPAENEQEEETANEGVEEEQTNEAEEANEVEEGTDEPENNEQEAGESDNNEEAAQEESNANEDAEEETSNQQEANDTGDRVEATFQGLADSHSMEVKTADGVEVVSFAPEEYELLGELSPDTKISYELEQTEDGMEYAKNVEVIE